MKVQVPFTVLEPSASLQYSEPAISEQHKSAARGYTTHHLRERGGVHSACSAFSSASASAAD